MDLVIRAAFIYFLLLLLLRISGKRQFADISTFDFVLLLIVSEAISQPVFGSDDEYSLTGAVILVSTLVLIDIALSHAKRWFRRLDDVIESVPVVLIDNGVVVDSNLGRERVDVDDVLESARATFGIEDLAQIKYAILERNGAITVIPRDLPWGAPNTTAPR